MSSVVASGGCKVEDPEMGIPRRRWEDSSDDWRLKIQDLYSCDVYESGFLVPLLRCIVGTSTGGAVVSGSSSETKSKLRPKKKIATKDKQFRNK